jgi:conflict system STAND superfamily ATPase
LFREHFQDFLLAQVSDERQRRWLAERVRARRWKENPFRGLQVFDSEHAPVFAGRTLAVDGVLTALIQQAKAGRPFVLVLGASGSGKSSLVRAGVLPLLIEPGVIEGIGLWRRSVMHPAMAESHTDMFDAFAAGLLAEEALPNLADLESKQPVKDLAADLRANPQPAT